MRNLTMTKYIFYVGDKRYTGTIKSETTTHYIIHDMVKDKEFQLPKSMTVLELVVEDDVEG